MQCYCVYSKYICKYAVYTVYMYSSKDNEPSAASDGARPKSESPSSTEGTSPNTRRSARL